MFVRAAACAFPTVHKVQSLAKKVVSSREIKSFVISKNVLSRQRDLSRDKKFFHVKNVNDIKWKDLS